MPRIADIAFVRAALAAITTTMAAGAAAFAVMMAVTAVGASAPAMAVQIDAHPAVERVRVIERIGATIPRDLVFRDQSARAVELGRYLEPNRPLVLVLAYYRCRMLCGLVLPELADAVRELEWSLGADYQVVTVSIDPRERPEDAQRKRMATLDPIASSGPVDGWDFLVGNPETVRRLAAGIGFGFAYDESTDQFAHPAVLVIVTPDGRVSRYLRGLDYAPAELALALRDARDGRTGESLRSAILRCFRFSPALRRYGPEIFAFLRGGALLILIGLAAMIGNLWRRERVRARG